MKYIFTLAAFFISLAASAQGVWNKSATNNAWNRTKADSVQIIPRDTASTNNALYQGAPVGDSARIAYKHGRFYGRDNVKFRTFAYLDEVGPGGGVTSFNGRTGTVLPLAGDYTTSEVAEGSNLYYTDARARAAFSAGPGLSYLAGVYSATFGTTTGTIAQGNDSRITGSEQTANKSTNTALGTSNTLYPSQLAVKTYVDNSFSGLTRTWQQVTTSGNSTDRFLRVTGANGIGGTGGGLELLYDSGDGAGVIQSYDRTGLAYRPQILSAAYHRFMIAGVEKVRIDADGKVGIGTTTPDALTRLDIRVPFAYTSDGFARMAIGQEPSSTDARRLLMGAGAAGGESVQIQAQSWNGSAWIPDQPITTNSFVVSGALTADHVSVADYVNVGGDLSAFSVGANQLRTGITTVTSSTTIGGGHTINANNSANITLTLPPAVSNSGRMLFIKKVSNNAFTVSIDPDGSENIDGSSTPVVISTYLGAVRVQCDGTSWWVY